MSTTIFYQRAGQVISTAVLSKSGTLPDKAPKTFVGDVAKIKRFTAKVKRYSSVRLTKATVLHEGRAALMLGDCLAVLRGLPDNCIDAVVCDPPYGLSKHSPELVTAVLQAWLRGERGEEIVKKQKGFMGKKWDGFVPDPVVWSEVYRVLKPGGHAAVFAGTRTVDLMGLSLRLAGFEVRDEIMVHGLVSWVQGAGFPKSRDPWKNDVQPEVEKQLRNMGVTGRIKWK